MTLQQLLTLMLQLLHHPFLVAAPRSAPTVVTPVAAPRTAPVATAAPVPVTNNPVSAAPTMSPTMSKRKKCGLFGRAHHLLQWLWHRWSCPQVFFKLNDVCIDVNGWATTSLLLYSKGQSLPREPTASSLVIDWLDTKSWAVRIHWH